MKTSLKDTREQSRFFREEEAWKLFRLAAFGEAFGWTFLILGILFKYFVTPNTNIPVAIVGQIHGTLFIIYIAAVLVLHQSMRWSIQKTTIAGLLSIPPYGTLAFEQYEAWKRKKQNSYKYRELIVRGLILYEHKLLMVQTKQGVDWIFPGGSIKENLGLEESLKYQLKDQFGIDAKIGPLRYIFNDLKTGRSIELFFDILNFKDFIELNNFNTKELDEAIFLNPINNKDIKPKFFIKHTFNYSKNAEPVKFIK